MKVIQATANGYRNGYTEGNVNTVTVDYSPTCVRKFMWTVPATYSPDENVAFCRALVELIDSGEFKTLHELHEFLLSESKDASFFTPSDFSLRMTDPYYCLVQDAAALHEILCGLRTIV